VIDESCALLHTTGVKMGTTTRARRPIAAMPPGSILSFLSPKAVKTPVATPVAQISSVASVPSATPTPSPSQSPSKAAQKSFKSEDLKKTSSPSQSIHTFFSPSKTKSLTAENTHQINKPRDVSNLEKRPISNVVGAVNPPSSAKRPCVSSNSLLASDGVSNHNTSVQRLYGLVRVPISELTDCPSQPSQQPETKPAIIALEQDCIYGRGPLSTKRHPFRSLGNDVTCEGISRKQVRISKVYDDKSGIDFQCCAGTKNKIGIIPYLLNTDFPSGQKRQIQLHASKKQNGVFYVNPGNSAQLQVNDWIIFDLYRRIPKHVFRLIWLKDEVAEASFLERKDHLSMNDATDASSLVVAEQDIDLEATRCMFSSNETSAPTNAIDLTGGSEESETESLCLITMPSTSDPAESTPLSAEPVDIAAEKGEFGLTCSNAHEKDRALRTHVTNTTTDSGCIVVTAGPLYEGGDASPSAGNEGVNGNSSTSSELHSSLSNLLWRALNSAEPNNGASILTELLSIYSIVPGKGMYKQIFELLVDGPTCEGHGYLDPNKSEIVLRYAQELARKFPLLTTGPDWDAISRLYDRITNINATDWSEGSHDRFCVMQQAACALEYLQLLMENDLSAVRSHHRDEMKKDLSNRVSYSFFLNQGGIRDSLKQTARTAMQFMIQNNSAFLSTTVVSGEIHERCIGAALRCLKGLGKLTYLVSSLFCISEGIDQASNDLCFLIKDAIEAELSRVRMKAVEQKRLKISFLIYLSEADVMSPFVTRLVAIMRLTKEFSFLIV